MSASHRVAICVCFVVREVDVNISCSLFPGGFDPKDASFQEYKLVHAENVAKVRASADSYRARVAMLTLDSVDSR